MNWKRWFKDLKPVHISLKVSFAFALSSGVRFLLEPSFPEEIRTSIQIKDLPQLKDLTKEPFGAGRFLPRIEGLDHRLVQAVDVNLDNGILLVNRSPQK